MKDRYVFIFNYNEDWMIVLYENGVNVKYFNSVDNNWDDSLSFTELFLENGGNKYHYKLPSYAYIENMNIFELKNSPINLLEKYLLG